MKLNSLFVVAIVAGAVALSVRSQTTPPKPAALSAKIAVIAMNDAMLATIEGKAAVAGMQAKYEPRRAKLEKEGAAIQALEDQLRKGGATMTREAQQKTAAEITTRKKQLERDLDDLNTDAQADDNRLKEDLTTKMGTVIDQFAKQNGYTVVIDASAPLLWAAESANVTPDVIKVYDQAHPAKK